MIRVLLADDHPLILRGVRELLAGEADFEIVGAETDPGQVPVAVARLEPDVLIQDLQMAGELSGLTVIRTVRARHPATKIVVLSAYAAPATICEAIDLGAAGYVSKLDDLHLLVQTVRNVHCGQSYFGDPVTGCARAQPPREGNGDPTGHRSLPTRRELEVLRLVALGHTSGEIADTLNIGRRTVESHRANLGSKLGAHNPAELVRYAIERGLVSPA